MNETIKLIFTLVLLVLCIVWLSSVLLSMLPGG